MDPAAIERLRGHASRAFDIISLGVGAGVNDALLAAIGALQHDPEAAGVILGIVMLAGSHVEVLAKLLHSDPHAILADLRDLIA